MTLTNRLVKRSFDILASAFGLVVFAPVILITWYLAAKDTGASGFFLQTRIGRNAQPFKVVKIRTMQQVVGTTVTTRNDARITPLGAKFRRWKLDELPQLWNVLKGEMSFVGPRPDVPGYLDRLSGRNSRLLALRPGITGPATLHYRNEEDLLAQQPDPQRYNDEVIWPEKVRINLDYLDNWSFHKDLQLIFRTVFQ